MSQIPDELFVDLQCASSDGCELRRSFTEADDIAASGWLMLVHSGEITVFCPAHQDDPRMWAWWIGERGDVAALREFCERHGSRATKFIRTALPHPDVAQLVRDALALPAEEATPASAANWTCSAEGCTCLHPDSGWANHYSGPPHKQGCGCPFCAWLFETLRASLSEDLRGDGKRSAFRLHVDGDHGDLFREALRQLRDQITAHLGDAVLSLYAREFVSDVVNLPSMPSDRCCSVLNDLRERAEAIARGEFPCVNRNTAEPTEYRLAFVKCSLGHVTTMRSGNRPVRAKTAARCGHDGICEAAIVEFGFY